MGFILRPLTWSAVRTTQLFAPVVCCEHRGVTDQLARARADLAAGRAWKARDRLDGLLSRRQDAEILDLLATVHQRMLNLPAAGALWFATGRDDEVARKAIAAWRERHGNDSARWRSIPSPVRQGELKSNLRELRQRAGDEERAGEASPSGEGPTHAWIGVVVGAGAVAFVLGVIAMIAVGVTTTVRWIFD